MKKTMLALAMLWTCGASAWTETSPTIREYTFKFTLHRETYEVTQAGGSYEDAFEKAASSCAKHFKNGRSLSEDQKLDIVDVCANPRR